MATPMIKLQNEIGIAWMGQRRKAKENRRRWKLIEKGKQTGRRGA